MSGKKGFITLVMLFLYCLSVAQEGIRISLKVVDEKHQPLPIATVELLRAKDSLLLKAQVSDSSGEAAFDALLPGSYLWRVSRVGYQTILTKPVSIPASQGFSLPEVVMQKASGQLSNVTITAQRPFIEMQAGKTVVNVEASLTSIGATAMEALEKLPGITVDKDGNIAIKGRTGVMVMIDGKQTWLDPSQLATLLNGMSASQISQVEIMENPSAKYDAAGNAGIINIKTKKNKQKGFNGSITTAYAQGRYPKNNNNIQLNYRSGRWNFFANYSANINKHFTKIYALRTYYEDDDQTVLSFLEQPSYMLGSGQTHVLRTGADYSISNKTTIGITINGLALNRKNTSDNPAEWKAPNGLADSVIMTHFLGKTGWKHAGGNLNFRHAFNVTRELTADVDILGYRIRGEQFFENNLLRPSTYSQANRAELPSNISIISAKADYSQELGKYKVESGFKTSHTSTDNLAAYELREGLSWKPDYGKTNHFLYKENIHALYTSMERKMGKLTVQAGLRYEMTNYDAHQLGNVMVKDSSFSRSYNSLFPTLFASLQADSLHQFSFSAGRRIDRPAFQKLNPFLFIINKYTYQQGNPFYKPQYTWNIELSHSYKNKLMTGLSYSITKDYFSQIFPVDTTGIVYYTEGNLGSLRTFGLSAGIQLSPFKWWSFNMQAVLSHKIMKGIIGIAYEADITQLNLNMNQQFRFNKGWSAELSGFYTSKSQHDIQEIVDPAGQLSVGVGKTIMKSKGTIKLAARDIFYTQLMKGFTYFTHATEYFKLTRDTRVLNLSFTYRFGKTFKTQRRSAGAASEEIQRVGNG